MLEQEEQDEEDVFPRDLFSHLARARDEHSKRGDCGNRTPEYYTHEKNHTSKGLPPSGFSKIFFVEMDSDIFSFKGIRNNIFAAKSA